LDCYEGGMMKSVSEDVEEDYSTVLELDKCKICQLV
jgi:hypothetical protein